MIIDGRTAIYGTDVSFQLIHFVCLIIAVHVVVDLLLTQLSWHQLDAWPPFRADFHHTQRHWSIYACFGLLGTTHQ
jgi:hypothetical protein